MHEGQGHGAGTGERNGARHACPQRQSDGEIGELFNGKHEWRDGRSLMQARQVPPPDHREFRNGRRQGRNAYTSGTECNGEERGYQRDKPDVAQHVKRERLDARTAPRRGVKECGERRRCDEGCHAHQMQAPMNSAGRAVKITATPDSTDSRKAAWPRKR